MEYTPLRGDLDEIRVITILPTSADGLVHCTVEVVSLLDRIWEDGTHSPVHHPTESQTPELDPRSRSTSLAGASATKATEVPDPAHYRFKWGDYACLSYSWGDPTKTARIIANGAQIEVPTNLEACLQAMQKQSMFSGRFKVWIDAICINQRDIAERGLQVGKMRELYTV